MIKKIYSLVAILIAFLIVLPTTSHAATFNDVPSTHPYYEHVSFLLEKGVIKESTNYGINNIVTREEVAVMVAKAVGLDGTQRSTKFSDVPKSNSNSGYIQSAAEAGILGGYPDGTFKPKNKVTRGQMAVFIANAFDLPVGTTSFKDVKYGQTGFTQIKQLISASITSGYPDNTFRPNNNLTRGHISVFLTKAIKYQESLSNPTNLTGSGDVVTKAVKLNKGPLVMNLTNVGDSNFIVTLYTSKGEYVDLVVNGIGNYNATQGVMIEESGNYYYEIQSDGEWSIGLSQHVSAKDVLKDTSAKGFGNNVVFMELKEGAYTVSSTHDGESNFIVWGNNSLLLANEIGKYSGSKVLRVYDSGLYLINVEADGNWTFNLK